MSDSFMASWTIAHQAPLPMGFSRQEHWSGLPCSPPGNLLDPEIEPISPALAGGFFTSVPPGKPRKSISSKENFHLFLFIIGVELKFLWFSFNYFDGNSCSHINNVVNHIGKISATKSSLFSSNKLKMDIFHLEYYVSYITPDLFRILIPYI